MRKILGSSKRHMPKYRGEHDPIDDPSMRDLEAGKDLADQARQEIHEIYELSDQSQWLEYGHHIPDPEQLLIKVKDIRQMTGRLPVVEQRQIEKELREVVERALRVYPAFVADLVERFGHAQKYFSQYAKDWINYFSNNNDIRVEDSPLSRIK